MFAVCPAKATSIRRASRHRATWLRPDRRGCVPVQQCHEGQDDCGMHPDERDGEYPRNFGERNRSSRPVNRRHRSDGSVRRSKCRRAVSRLTVHCRHACHRSNSANIMMAFFVSYMMNTKRQCCEHKGSMRRYDVRSDSDERQPRLCTAAVHDRRRTHSTGKAPEACPGASSLQRLACLQRLAPMISLGVRAGRGGWPLARARNARRQSN